jgi:hypothetical protein
VASPPAYRDSPAQAVSPADLPLFRFGLRHLFLLMAGVSAVLACLVSLQGITAVAFLLAALVVTFHVLGTALGSQLRRHANRADAASPAQAKRDGRGPLGSTPHAPQAISLPWYGRSGSSLAWLPRVVAASMFFGGCLGALILTATLGQRTSLAGLLVGAFSLAVVSGWFAFLAGSFIAIVRGGLRDAVADTNRDERPGSAAT